MDKTESSPGTVFAREPIDEFWDEAYPLALRNVEETGALGVAEFKPCQKTYENLQASGALVCFTARLNGVLVGYSINWVHTHAQFSSTLWAFQDVLYYSKEHRGFASARFLVWQDLELKRQGVQFILRQVHKSVDYSRTLERMGYEAGEQSFVKRF
jgi:hypothetical protein